MDTSTNTTEIKLDFLFVDEDTRIQKVKNPKNNLSKANIEELNAWLQANNVVVGDKTGATFARVRKAVVVNTTKTELDLKLNG